MRSALLGWYHAARRTLPFRETRDPYAILVAEILLQRTRVKAGLPYYERFLAAFPTVRDLADASEAEVLRAWEGLGFYRRARNLHRAAKIIVDKHAGEVPAEVDALRGLPGVGDYTAGAVGSIAFGVRVPAVDGNATRVLARLFRIEDDLTKGDGKAMIRAIAADLVPADAPGIWNQALMELGATVCTPRHPRCPACPLAPSCLAFEAGTQEELPRAQRKPPVPSVPVVFAVVRHGGSVLLLRREGGLHTGLYGLPGGEIGVGEREEAAIRRHLRVLGLRLESVETIGRVRHAFSHLRWEGTAFSAEGRGEPSEGSWVPLDRLDRLPMVPAHRRLLDRVIY